jgi:hypothetical protein
MQLDRAFAAVRSGQQGKRQGGSVMMKGFAAWRGDEAVRSLLIQEAQFVPLNRRMRSVRVAALEAITPGSKP